MKFILLVILIFTFSILTCTINNPQNEKDPNNLEEWYKIPNENTLLEFKIEVDDFINENKWEYISLRRFVEYYEEPKYFEKFNVWIIKDSAFLNDEFVELDSVEQKYCISENDIVDFLFFNVIIKTPIEIGAEIFNDVFKLEIREINVQRTLRAGIFDSLIIMDVLIFNNKKGECYYSPLFAQWIYLEIDYRPYCEIYYKEELILYEIP